LTVLLVGCGAVSSGPVPTAPGSLPEMREFVRQSVDSKLKRLGVPAKRIDCVDRKIAKMTPRQFAERLVEGVPVGPGAQESSKSIAGPFGKGCL
jgi:hypothetical protein